MKTFLPILWVFACLCASSCAVEKDDLALSSPDGHIRVVLNLREGELFYHVIVDEDTVLHPAALGLVLEDEDLSTGLTYASSSEVKQINDNYGLYHGKQSSIAYEASHRVFYFQKTGGSRLGVEWSVSNDGVGFRYLLPDTADVVRVITEEVTGFGFSKATKSWLQPMSVAKTGWRETNPSYEEYYEQGIDVGTPSPLGEGWVYPALFNSGAYWMLVSETGLDEQYCGTRLQAAPGTSTMKVTFPQREEVWPGKALYPNNTTPWATPWRVVAIGSLATIVESTLGTDLAMPAIDMDESFIRPGYASWSWVLMKDGSITYEVQKEFIDYAAEMNWQYTLVDVDWDTTIGYGRIAELSEYALQRGVGLLLWYNSSGSWNSTTYHPKSKLLTHEQRVKEFTRLRDMGIKGVKVDFFGGDGQSMIAYYHDILKDAANFGLLVNFHGCTLPRGWHRTYPNLMTAEAIRGYEFITFTQENADKAPAHAAIVPFTRNVFDPMDFTPMVLDSIPGIHRRTTNGFELALPTLFLSGIQHMAERPRGMATVPHFVQEYLRNLPARWEETKFIAGYPGKDVVIARRSGHYWYISGINGENQHKALELDLSFLNGTGIVITDGEQRRSFKKSRVSVEKEKPFQIKMVPYGGFVMKINAGKL